jgi:hypothetical protein
VWEASGALQSAEEARQRVEGDGEHETVIRQLLDRRRVRGANSNRDLPDSLLIEKLAVRPMELCGESGTENPDVTVGCVLMNPFHVGLGIFRLEDPRVHWAFGWNFHFELLLLVDPNVVRRIR